MQAARAEDFCGFDPRSDDPALFIFDPVEGLTTRLRVASYGGLILAMPVVLWQIWRFIVPALHAKEKRYAIPFILTSVLLFLLGGLLAYLTLGQGARVPDLLGRRRRRRAVPGQQVHPPRRC